MTSAERRGRNEALFREVNDRIADMSAASDLIEFICECSDRSCLTTFHVDIAVYREVRSHDNRFLVAPGHVDPEIESVAQSRGAFVVVEKHGVAELAAHSVSDAPAA